jgi:biotin carboxyl carrier protein
LRITAQAGTAVKAGDEILVMEAMKMEMPIKAPKDGVIGSIAVANGAKVNAGDTLATM